MFQEVKRGFEAGGYVRTWDGKYYKREECVRTPRGVVPGEDLPREQRAFELDRERYRWLTDVDLSSLTATTSAEGPGAGVRGIRAGGGGRRRRRRRRRVNARSRIDIRRLQSGQSSRSSASWQNVVTRSDVVVASPSPSPHGISSPPRAAPAAPPHLRPRHRCSRSPAPSAPPPSASRRRLARSGAARRGVSDRARLRRPDAGSARGVRVGRRLGPLATAASPPRVAALAASVAVALAPCSPALAGSPRPRTSRRSPHDGFRARARRGAVRDDEQVRSGNRGRLRGHLGLAPGAHAINVHELGGGTCADGASCVGPSFNPQERPHGGPNALKKFGASACHFVGEGCLLWRHIGDLGNIEAGADGVSAARFKDQYVSLKPGKEANIVGRSVVIRERADDFVTQGDQDGDAGKSSPTAPSDPPTREDARFPRI